MKNEDDKIPIENLIGEEISQNHSINLLTCNKKEKHEWGMWPHPHHACQMATHWEQCSGTY